MYRDPSRIRPTLRQEWIRYRQRPLVPGDRWLRAGIPGAYLPPGMLDVPHTMQERVALSVPACAAMVLEYFGREVETHWLAELLRTDDLSGTPGERLGWLRPWGYRIEFPTELQFYRDGTVELNRRLGANAGHLVYRWEEPWLRYVTAALETGLPPILFVDMGRLYPRWRGLSQPHAVVLCGGEGRRAWIQDPSQPDGPTRVGLSRLMDSLLPGEPLAALLYPDGFGGEGE